jgi:hypothetical protein
MRRRRDKNFFIGIRYEKNVSIPAKGQDYRA